VTIVGQRERFDPVCAVERLRRTFAECFSVFNRKAPQLCEAKTRRNFGHFRQLAIRRQKSLSRTWSGSSTLARAKTSACLTRSRRDFRPRIEEVSATAAIHRSIATEQTYALRESTSHQTTQGCVQAILSFGAIGSFNGYLWPENARPKKVETIILSARQSRRLRQTIGRSASASPYGGEP
jgi:hypothetical protein